MSGRIVRRDDHLMGLRILQDAVGEGDGREQMPAIDQNSTFSIMGATADTCASIWPPLLGDKGYRLVHSGS
jgi:hypothetical protein